MTVAVPAGLPAGLLRDGGSGRGRGTIIYVLFPFSVLGITTGHTLFYGGRRYSHYELHGSTAMVQGIAYIAFGAFAHFRWFWGLYRRLASWGNPLEFAAAATGIGCCLYVGIRVLWFSFETGY